MHGTERRLLEARDRLSTGFAGLHWNFEKDRHSHELISRWLGEPDEDVMVCVFKGKLIDEPFHRQDFYFFNFAWQNSYDALSNGSDSHITVNEGDCYIGQPYSGYALKGKRNEDMIIVGVLIRRNVFFKEYISTLSQGGAIFRFFLDPERRPFSDAALHFPIGRDSCIWSLLETMIIEYAYKNEYTQKVLKPLVLVLCMFLAKKLRELDISHVNKSLAEQIVIYIHNESQLCSLHGIARYFGYHPNYISALLRKETGKTFSEILLSARMEKANLLLSNTELTNEEIAEMLGYSSTSNFYKAYRLYYGKTPRGKNNR